jgi:hypothetical protein
MGLDAALRAAGVYEGKPLDQTILAAPTCRPSPWAMESSVRRPQMTEHAAKFKGITWCRKPIANTVAFALTMESITE